MLICYLETRRVCCTKKRSQAKREIIPINYRILQEDVQGEDSDVEEERNRVKLLVQEHLRSGVTKSDNATVSQLMI